MRAPLRPPPHIQYAAVVEQAGGSVRSVLCAEADDQLRRAWVRHLRPHGVEVEHALSPGEALEKQRRNRHRLVLLHFGLGGARLVADLAAASPRDAAVIAISGGGDPRHRRAAVEVGARMFLDRHDLTDKTVPWLVARHLEGSTPHPFVGDSAAARSVRGRIAVLADATEPVLIVGETGAGKGVVAREIHDASRRRFGPFVHLDCGAIARGLVESDLFGHERGAFTGAIQRRAGAFERASGGTLFLDEIGELPFDLQAKLLHVLEAGAVPRLGGAHDVSFAVHVIAATNADLETAVCERRFRRDLLARLDVHRVEVPPLRDRTDDVLELFHHFASHGSRVLELTPLAEERLRKYSWPDNVRELRSVVGRLQQEGVRPQVDVEQLVHVGRVHAAAAGRALRRRITDRVFDLAVDCPEPVLEVVERDVLEEGLRRHRGNQAALSRTLRMDPDAVRRRLRAHGLQPSGPGLASTRADNSDESRIG